MLNVPATFSDSAKIWHSPFLKSIKLIRRAPIKKVRKIVSFFLPRGQSARVRSRTSMNELYNRSQRGNYFMRWRQSLRDFQNIQLMCLLDAVGQGVMSQSR